MDKERKQWRASRVRAVWIIKDWPREVRKGSLQEVAPWLGQYPEVTDLRVNSDHKLRAMP